MTTILRPQLCDYACELVYEKVDLTGHPLVLQFIKKCKRHQNLSDKEAAAAIRDETNQHNAAIESGVKSLSCYVKDGVVKWQPQLG